MIQLFCCCKNAEFGAVSKSNPFEKYFQQMLRKKLSKKSLKNGVFEFLNVIT